jgi:hypothetical protein
MPWTSAGHGSFANASSTVLSLRLIHPAARLSVQQPHPGEFMRRIALGLLVTTAISGPVLAAPIQTVFVVGMENHNLTQPSSFTSIQQLLGNSAAPYLNSLITPGNQNAKYTSYTTRMTNVAPGIHPSEPNYIWENGGSNFGVASDADPAPANGNVIASRSMTGLMTSKGIPWKSYQEDVQYSTSPLKSVSGTGGTAPSGVPVTTNPFNGTSQYNFAVKHNPMAFFSDSNTDPRSSQTFSQLQTDLANNTYGKFNWITPNQFNDMHSALTGGFTYNGTHFTGDQAAVAQGDNFLSQLIPQLEATNAFQDGSGMIEIWFDESEGGDTSDFDIPEIFISKDAIGNAFDVTELLTHSADLLSFEEMFQLGECLGASCNSPDLSAAFVAGSIPEGVPEPASLALLGAGVLGTGLVRLRRG